MGRVYSHFQGPIRWNSFINGSAGRRDPHLEDLDFHRREDYRTNRFFFEDRHSDISWIECFKKVLIAALWSICQIGSMVYLIMNGQRLSSIINK